MMWAGIDPLSIGVAIALSLALSLAANALQKKPRRKSQRIDDSPSMTATRGAPIPPLIGRDRVGPVVGYTGNRRWFSFSEGIVAIEDAWHQICVGPGYRLHAIRSAGRVIWKGPITRDSHPSGSQIDIPGVGSFRIYWGDRDQPVDPLLASVTGVASRWPNLMYLVWTNRNIGPFAQWELHDYDVEVRPLPSVELVLSSSWYPGTDNIRRENDSTYPIRTSTPAQSIITMYLGDPDNPPDDLRDFGFWATRRIYIEDSTTIPDGSYDVAVIGAPYIEFEGLERLVLQDLVIAGSVPAGTSDGFVYPLYENPNDGANPAHILWQLLFAPPPHGRGLPTTLIDMASLETIGIEADRDRLPSHVLAADGEDLRAIIAGILQDLGCFLTFDPRIGKHRFVLIREPEDDSVIQIPSGALLDPIPEVVTSHGLGANTCPTFTFKDRLRSYRDETVPQSDDATASLEGMCKPVQIDLLLPRDLTTATLMSKRRSQEDLGQVSGYEINVNRASRDLIPGMVIFLPASAGFPGALRIIDARPTPLSSRYQLHCLLDRYGASQSDIFDEDDEGGDGEITEPTEDLAVYPLELPSFLAPNSIVISVARVRANTATQSAELWLSPDDAVYKIAATEVQAAAGGLLLNDLAASGNLVLETGFEITAFGPEEDIEEIPDLRGDLFAWRSGQTVAIVNQELMFIRNVTLVSPGVYRLDGVLRARYDSMPGAHVSGDQVLVVTLSDLQRITDPLFAPGVTRFLKSLPRTYRTLPIDDATSLQFALNGRGLKPMQPTALRTGPVRGRLNAYLVGEDIPLSWCYRSRYGLANRTGAGMQGFGKASGTTAPDGRFRVDILDPDDQTVVRSFVDLTAPAVTYQYDHLIDDFATPPQSFVVQVREIVSGYTSAPATATVQRLVP